MFDERPFPVNRSGQPFFSAIRSPCRAGRSSRPVGTVRTVDPTGFHQSGHMSQNGLLAHGRPGMPSALPLSVMTRHMGGRGLLEHSDREESNMHRIFGMVMVGGFVLGMASLAACARFVGGLRRLPGGDHNGVGLRVLSGRLCARGPAGLARDDHDLQRRVLWPGTEHGVPRSALFPVHLELSAVFLSLGAVYAPATARHPRTSGRAMVS